MQSKPSLQEGTPCSIPASTNTSAIASSQRMTTVGAIVNQERFPNTLLRIQRYFARFPGPIKPSSQLRIQNLSRKNDGAGKALADHEDKRPIDEERSWPNADDTDSH